MGAPGGTGYQLSGRALFLTLALALCWCWQTSLNYLSDGQAGFAGSSWYASNAGVFLKYLLVIALMPRLRGFFNLRLAPVVVVGCQVLATVARLLLGGGLIDGAATSGWIGVMLTVSWHLFSALGTAGVAVMLFDGLVSMPRPADRHFAVLMGTVLSLLLAACVSGLPLLVRSLLAVVLPIGGIACILRARGSTCGEACGAVGRESVAVRPSGLSGLGAIRAALRAWGGRSLAVVFVFALSLNFIRVATESVGEGGLIGRASVSAMAAVLVISAVCVEFCLRGSMGRVLPVILALFVTIVIACSFFGGGPALWLAASLSMASYLYYVTYLWRISAVYAQDARDDLVALTRVMAIGFAVNALGLLAGASLARAVFQMQYMHALFASMLVAYLVFIAGFMLSWLGAPYALIRKGTATEWPSDLGITAGGDGGLRGQYGRRCADLARDRGLTAREEEVLVMVVAGMRLLDIAEELDVSINTVKTHAAHTYQKLGVHSRDELIELLRSQDLG